MAKAHKVELVKSGSPPESAAGVLEAPQNPKRPRHSASQSKQNSHILDGTPAAVPSSNPATIESPRDEFEMLAAPSTLPHNRALTLHGRNSLIDVIGYWFRKGRRSVIGAMTLPFSRHPTAVEYDQLLFENAQLRRQLELLLADH
jgi:hypothetical protein